MGKKKGGGWPEHHSIQHIGETLWEPFSQTSMKNGISKVAASHLHSKSLLVGTLVFFVLTFNKEYAKMIYIKENKNFNEQNNGKKWKEKSKSSSSYHLNLSKCNNVL